MEQNTKIERTKQTIKELSHEILHFSGEDSEIQTNPRKIILYKRLNIELAIISSKFCCHKCQSNKNITFHHLIGRVEKQFTNWRHYFLQRNHYKNIIVLCMDCHNERNEIGLKFNVVKDDDKEKVKPLSLLKINRIKRIYGVE
jgi:5-methylcytosine-specific restriction endonuclease McrA